MLRQTKQGQTTVEYVIIVVIVLGAFLAIQNYAKRGIQGRWKASIDELGDQYDPRFAKTSIRHTIMTNTDTSILATPTANGFWTTRIDKTNSVDRKTGYMAVGAY